MTPVPVHVGSCPRCGASVFLGQSWCQRCFTTIDSGTLAVPSSPSADSSAPSDVPSAPPDVPSSQFAVPSSQFAVPSAPPADEAVELDTAAWKSVHLVSEAWDLADPGPGEGSFPMTRMEIRHARARHRKRSRKKRAFRTTMLAVTSLLVAGGLAAGGLLVWQRYYELTPRRYATEITSTVNRADATVASVQTMVNQLEVSDLPTAGQILDARRAQSSFASCASKLITVTAPGSLRSARLSLISGCRDYASVMGDVTAVGVTRLLIDLGRFNADLVAANSAWGDGTSAAGVTGAVLATTPSATAPPGANLPPPPG